MCWVPGACLLALRALIACGVSCFHDNTTRVNKSLSSIALPLQFLTPASTSRGVVNVNVVISMRHAWLHFHVMALHFLLPAIQLCHAKALCSLGRSHLTPFDPTSSGPTGTCRCLPLTLGRWALAAWATAVSYSPLLLWTYGTSCTLRGEGGLRG